MSEFWNGLSRGARLGLGAALLALLATLAGATWWLWRTDYQVLFADMKPQDAAAIVAELDRLKQPYQLAAGGTTILVDEAAVHGTRLKLMGKDVPLHGAVGFELFNNADFGMTEFAQKINYQRALQGEITRTILSLAEVRDARVHLALPEEGLFKRATSKAKAAITLTLKPGQTLRAEQIGGIQKLVAAAVPGIVPGDVTLVDQRGVALSRAGGADGEPEPMSSRLDLKKETEQLLARKAGEVLERALGPGQALASVDVVLALDQVRTTTEDVLGAPTRSGQAATGVIVRERETLRGETPAPLDARAGAAGRSGGGQREVDYQVGRRVEQVVTVPGAIRRLHLVAVLRRPADAAQLEQLRVLLGAAVGASPERGDVVVVQTMAAFAAQGLPAAEGAAPSAGPLPPEGPPVATTAGELDERGAPVSPAVLWLAGLVGVAALIVGAGLLGGVRRRRPSVAAPAPTLTEAERAALLGRIEQWLAADPLPTPAPGRPAHPGPGAVRAPVLTSSAL